MSEIPEHDIPINYERASEFLAKEKFPAGLVEAFLKNLETIPMRFFVCDDSGSMNAGDGNKLMETSSGAIMSVTCSRYMDIRGVRVLLTIHLSVCVFVCVAFSPS